MAKTLRTGDVKRLDADVLIVASDRWVTFGGELKPIGFKYRASARFARSALSGSRIAKIIKRTPKYVFVEVSK